MEARLPTNVDELGWLPSSRCIGLQQAPEVWESDREVKLPMSAVFVSFARVPPKA
jgi:hypothetical protein